MDAKSSDETLVDKVIGVFKATDGRPLLEQVGLHIEFIESVLPENSARGREYAELRKAYYLAAEIKGGDSAIVHALID